MISNRFSPRFVESAGAGLCLAKPTSPAPALDYERLKIEAYELALKELAEEQ